MRRIASRSSIRLQVQLRVVHGRERQRGWLQSTLPTLSGRTKCERSSREARRKNERTENYHSQTV